MQKLKDGIFGVATVCLSIAILGLVAVTFVSGKAYHFSSGMRANHNLKI